MWIPVGAGGRKIVEICARIYESVAAALGRRELTVLMHTALVVTTESGRTVIECAWPSPDAELTERGVVVVGPVFSRFLGRIRTFRYEVRCWREGIIPDLAYALSTLRVSGDPDAAKRVIATVASVPAHCWGRDERNSGDMWNSNSVISYVLVKAGISVIDIEPPPGTRAPGWTSGVAAAKARGHGTNGRSLPANRP